MESGSKVPCKVFWSDLLGRGQPRLAVFSVEYVGFKDAGCTATLSIRVFTMANQTGDR